MMEGVVNNIIKEELGKEVVVVRIIIKSIEVLTEVTEVTEAAVATPEAINLVLLITIKVNNSNNTIQTRTNHPIIKDNKTTQPQTSTRIISNTIIINNILNHSIKWQDLQVDNIMDSNNRSLLFLLNMGNNSSIIHSSSSIIKCMDINNPASPNNNRISITLNLKILTQPKHSNTNMIKTNEITNIIKKHKIMENRSGQIIIILHS